MRPETQLKELVRAFIAGTDDAMERIAACVGERVTCTGIKLWGAYISEDAEFERFGLLKAAGPVLNEIKTMHRQLSTAGHPAIASSLLRDHLLRKLPHFSRAASYTAIRPMIRALQQAFDKAVATIVFGASELHPVTATRTHLPGRIGGAGFADLAAIHPAAALAGLNLALQQLARFGPPCLQQRVGADSYDGDVGGWNDQFLVTGGRVVNEFKAAYTDAVGLAGGDDCVKDTVLDSLEFLGRGVPSRDLQKGIMTLFHIATVDDMASQVQGFRGNRTSVDGRAFAAAVRATPFGAMLFVRPCLETLHADFLTQANLWAGMHLTQYQTVVGAGLWVGTRYVVVNEFADQLLTTSVAGAAGFIPTHNRVRDAVQATQADLLGRWTIRTEDQAAQYFAHFLPVGTVPDEKLGVLRGDGQSIVPIEGAKLGEATAGPFEFEFKGKCSLGPVNKPDELDVFARDVVQAKHDAARECDAHYGAGGAFLRARLDLPVQVITWDRRGNVSKNLPEQVRRMARTAAPTQAHAYGVFADDPQKATGVIAFFHLRRLRVAVGNAIADMVRSRAQKFAHAAALQRATGDHHAGGAPGGLPDDAGGSQDRSHEVYRVADELGSHRPPRT